MRRRIVEPLPPATPDNVPQLVDALLTAARSHHATDIHLVPDASALVVCWRIDGVLQRVAELPIALAPNIVARLKVLARLLTYRADVPQEGGIRQAADGVETRVSTFPTLFGEKAVLRLFAEQGRLQFLEDLGLPGDVLTHLQHLLAETSGAVLLTGPAGSGKSTTIYACLREMVNNSAGGRSLVSLEDPVEVVVPGVAQSQIQPAAGFDMQVGLRSLLRQDPEVILVGEIRDQRIARIVLEGSLTGHLMLSTFHAGTAAMAISRLSEMGIEPYQLRSGILAIVSQRLVRKLCACARESDRTEDRLGMNVTRSLVPVGCDTCWGTGYHGRMVLAEVLIPDLQGLGRSILSRSDATAIQEQAVAAGMIPLWQRACEAVNQGLTSAREVRRVFGFTGN